MFDSLRYSYVKLNIFSSITFALIILVIIFADSMISNVPLHFDAFENGSSYHNQLQTHQAARILKITSPDDIVLSLDVTRREEPLIQAKNRLKPEELRMFEASDLGRRFDARVRKFFSRNQCKVQIFMTWISPVDSFGDREFFGLESLFQTNPTTCVIIVSWTMDSGEGLKILEPLIDLGFRVQAMTPDLWGLIRNTPAESWFNDIKNGIRNPGEIPLAQNLSNLIRLAVLYKYGGIYLDTDFIVLKDFSGLRNSIGAQSIDVNGNWTRLNNAVLIFDKNHPLVYKFLEEFALTFDGNIWGHNGPYLVSRVVNRLEKTGEFNFTVMPRLAFYPVDWTRVAGFFARPNDRIRPKWVKAKIRQLNRSTFGVHLWNSQSSRLKIEEGSIIARLISDHCVICSHRSSSSSQRGNPRNW